MSVETSIDALVREFEIEDERDDGSVKSKEAPEPESVEPPNPMSFLDEDVIEEPFPNSPEPPVPAPDEPTGPSVADLKKRAKEDHNQIVQLEKKAEIIQRYDLEDRAYMKAQLKTLISDNRAVMDVIESQLKIGTNPHLFEVYGNLSKLVADNVMRLAKIDQMVTDYKIVEDKGTGNIKHDLAKEQASAGGQTNITQINNNFTFQSSEILKLVKSAIPKIEKVNIEDLPKFNLQ